MADDDDNTDDLEDAIDNLMGKIGAPVQHRP
jgi:hypothetical protein